MGSFGSSKSEPVTWQHLMTPWQQYGMARLSPELYNQAEAGFQGYGFTPSERARKKTDLSGTLAQYAGGMREAAGNRTAASGMGGGVSEGTMQNIDAAKLMALAQGLRSMQTEESQRAQDNINRALGFVTWNPPTAQKSTVQNYGLL